MLKILSNPPQKAPAAIDILYILKSFEGNDKSQSFLFDLQEQQLIVEEYDIQLWLRQIDNVKVDKPNTFSILNLRSLRLNKNKFPGKGELVDKALELHHNFGSEMFILILAQLQIKGNIAKGQPYLSISYVYFVFENDGVLANSAEIKPGHQGETQFERLDFAMIFNYGD
ncbi:unnamed protein product [Paramecium sonneborni]|uniref:Uncharacterized protein n=1 Tax=Paramecium sonneborni TaxID=65129 RepID=A0A8S1RSH3_9CILI|nr:unnamed protein product [Paramecium sonneborni]